MTDRTLEHLPRIDIVAMGRATRVPDWYGDAVDDSFDVRCFVIHHPGGPIVIDAGIGRGNAFIEQIYAPETVDIGDALTSCEVDLAQVQALVLTHLHFDHCGQARRLCRSDLRATSRTGSGACAGLHGAGVDPRR